MESRSRSWALGLSFIGFFALLFSLGFVQQVKADDVSEYGTVIGIVRGTLHEISMERLQRVLTPIQQDLGTTYS